jgi:flagellar biogenesis protein FliO
VIEPSALLLLLVLGGMAAAPALLRKRRATAPDAVRVVGRTALHKNAVVAVVAVGDRRLLVGAGERGVHLLARLDDAEPDAVGGTTDRDQHDLLFTSTTTDSADRMDAAGSTFPSMPDITNGDAQDALAGLDLGTGTTIAGPGTGLVDRLREMTVRTPVSVRPLRVPLRR